jgi:hypothetical protein
MSRIRRLQVLWVLCFTVGLTTLCKAQHSSEQVIFANTDNPNSGRSQTGTFVYTNANPDDKFFGFWIWCEADSENPYAGDCQGSMYFYGLALTKHVTGHISEPSEGTYVMVVNSSDGKIACSLTNVPPIKSGLRNSVNASCSAPAGVGVSPNSVVHATGPS